MNKCSVKTGTYTKYGIYVSVVNYLAPYNFNTFRKKCLCKCFGFCCDNVSCEGSRFIQLHSGLKITDIHFRMLIGTPVYEPQQHRECRRETKGQ